MQIFSVDYTQIALKYCEKNICKTCNLLYVENWSAVIMIRLNLGQKEKEIAFVMGIIFVKFFEKYI